MWYFLSIICFQHEYGTGISCDLDILVTISLNTIFPDSMRPSSFANRCLEKRESGVRGWLIIAWFHFTDVGPTADSSWPSIIEAVGGRNPMTTSAPGSRRARCDTTLLCSELLMLLIHRRDKSWNASSIPTATGSIQCLRESNGVSVSHLPPRGFKLR